MPALIDYTDQIIGGFHVLERDYNHKHPKYNFVYWKCQCLNCGKIISIRSNEIKKFKSCGCLRYQGHSDETKIKISNSLKLLYKNSSFKEQMNDHYKYRRLNLIGQKYDRLTVLEYADEKHQKYYNGNHKPTWKCICDCGNIVYVTTECLQRGDTSSCGCIIKENAYNRAIDLSGNKYGHLTVLKMIESQSKNRKALVRCDCGKEYTIYISNLKNGVESCGCIYYSKGENKIKEILTSNDIKYIPQKTFEDFKFKDTNGTPRYDFFLPDYNILLEYDGIQHYKSIKYLGGEEKYKEIKDHDTIKDNYAIANGYIMIRIPYTHYNELCLDDLIGNNKNFIIKKENKCA